MSYDKAQATHEFMRWSESYDRSILQWLLFGPSHRAMIRRVRAVTGGRPFRVLDVGCGTGVFAGRLHEAFPEAEVWGVDLVAGMLAKGAERWRQFAGRVHPVQGDSERLPFAGNSFDVVTCANSFHHYPDQGRAVAEMHRVLRPGGRLLLIDGYRDGPWGWFIYDVCVAGVEGSVHHASKPRFRDLFRRAGLKSVSQHVFRGPAPFLLTEAVATQRAPAVPAPHFSTATRATTSDSVV
jgi:ubiquinone/menaquinone biosynthesis C-methylase UbiE